MAIGRRITVVVVDDHEVAVAVDLAGDLNHAGAGGHDGRAIRHREVDALVHAGITQHRMEAHAEA